MAHTGLGLSGVSMSSSSHSFRMSSDSLANDLDSVAPSSAHGDVELKRSDRLRRLLNEVSHNRNQESNLEREAKRRGLQLVKTSDPRDHHRAIRLHPVTFDGIAEMCSAMSKIRQVCEAKGFLPVYHYTASELGHNIRNGLAVETLVCSQCFVRSIVPY